MKLEVVSPATWIQKKEREMANLPIRSSRGVDVSANRKSGQTRWRVWLLVCSVLLFPLERATGEITFLNSWGSTGDKDGEFNNPNGITIGPSGNIYVTDSINHRIQIFSSNGTFIDKFGTFGPGDGEFSFPRDIAIAPISGELYVADQNNHRIQRFDSSNNFISKFGSQGTADGQFDQPHSVAITSTDKVYVADFNNDRIQKFDNDVDDTFLSKFGTTGSGDGNFVSPFDLALTPTDDLYVIDLETSRVQKFDNTDTFVSKFGSTGIGEVEFTKPHGVAVGSQGNLLVVDTDYHRIQKIKSDGTYISQFGSLGTADGQFDEPNGIAVTSTGLIYLTDTGNDRIQRFFDSDAWVSGPYPLSTNLRLDSNEVLGSTFQIDAFRTNLQVPGTLSLAANSVLALNGGMITADLILVEASATINLDAPFTNASRINLVDPSSRIQGAAFTNQALVYGNGHLAAPWINDTSGEVRASGNDRIVFSAVGNSNAGVMNILGGTVEFEKDLTNTGEVNLLGGILIVEQTLTNAASGFISGRGTIFANGGLNNADVLAFSGGLADIFGDVDNQAGGQIVTSGGGTTTFFDDVVHDGTEIRTSTGSSSVFFGAVSGGGPFTGAGTTFFEGDLRPGNSPASVSFEGNVVLGFQASTQIELGGTIAGAEFDQLMVAGDLALNGALEITLLEGFLPDYSQQYTIIDVAGVQTGQFEGLTEGSLVGHFGQDLFITYSGGDGNDVALFTASLPGDYNGDGLVDGADLSTWQEDFGGTTALSADGDADVDVDVDGADFLHWQRGLSSTTGNITANNIAVPEPDSMLLLMWAVALLQAVRIGAYPITNNRLNA